MNSRLQEILKKIPTARDAQLQGKLAEEALTLMSQAESPLLWANLNAMHAAAFMRTRSNNLDESILEKALKGYEAALTVFDPTADPQLWIETQRNLAATHLAGLMNNLGNRQDHGEAAINAYEKAIRLGDRVGSEQLWVRCHFDLIRTLQVALTWRGEAAVIEALKKCDEAAIAIGDGKFEGVIDAIRVERVSLLYDGVRYSRDYLERLIQYGTEALKAVEHKQGTFAWARVHLMLGSAYRMRVTGKKAENLEHAIHHLQNALTFYTSDDPDHNWHLVHFHLGPAYAYRGTGSQVENQEKALESLICALNAMPKEEMPERRAYIHYVIGFVYSKARGSNEQEDSQREIAAFETARSLLHLDSHRSMWLKTTRALGGAYLASVQHGAEPEIERAIQTLEEANGLSEPDVDVDDWCLAQANLAWISTDRNRPNAGGPWLFDEA